jgi:hypothetical protein
MGFEDPPAAREPGAKKPPACAGGSIKEETLAADYGEYVMVRTPATPPIVIVVPCEKPEG